jgi:hypothetical protein
MMVVDYAQKPRTGNRVGLHYSPFAASGCRIPQQFDGFGEPKNFLRGRIREVGLTPIPTINAATTAAAAVNATLLRRHAF